MSGFLQRLIARSHGEAAGPRPRQHSLFEPPADAAPSALDAPWDEAPVAPRMPVPPPPAVDGLPEETPSRPPRLPATPIAPGTADAATEPPEVASPIGARSVSPVPSLQTPDPSPASPVVLVARSVSGPESPRTAPSLTPRVLRAEPPAGPPAPRAEAPLEGPPPPASGPRPGRVPADPAIPASRAQPERTPQAASPERAGPITEAAGAPAEPRADDPGRAHLAPEVSASAPLRSEGDVSAPTPSTEVAGIPIRPAARLAPRAAAEVPARLGADPDATPEPTIHITIGRVEVRAVQPAPPPRRRVPERAPPLVSLDDYLSRTGTAR